jgi:hypothetical protein
MKADVQPSVSAEKEALQYATDYFRRYADGLKRNASLFNESFVSLLLELPSSKLVHPPEYALSLCIESAPQQPRATVVLCKLAAGLMEREDPLPSKLQKFIVEFLRNPSTGAKRGRGPDKLALRSRNDLIGFAINRIATTWKFPPTRNDASKGKRACAASIVREALASSAGIPLKEAAINDIWKMSHWKLYYSVKSKGYARGSDELYAYVTKHVGKIKGN